MLIENLEKIKGWTPPGNPSTQPVFFDIASNHYDYEFCIRYEGRTYEVVLSRMDNEDGSYDICFRLKGDISYNKTVISKYILRDMREFYDSVHTILYRISKGQFNKYY